MKQITKEQAITIGSTETWKKLNYLQLAGFQLYQSIVFCDFESYHDALNKALNRGEGFDVEGVRFRLENSEKLKKDWEELHNIPDFDYIMSILLPND